MNNHAGFDQMGLIAPLLGAVKASGYEVPTPIQRETIPLVLSGSDVLGCAQTGTGKTAAFALPILQLLNGRQPSASAKGGRRPIRSLILTPTRELALQIYENFTEYGAQLNLRACVIFGGVAQMPQTDALKRGVDILVATPGRLNDLIGQGYIALNELEIFVLDEADRMLDMGFIHDVKKVLKLLPEKRQTLFFSATMPAPVEQLAVSILRAPKLIKVDPVTSTVDAIRQSVYLIDKLNKKYLLAQLLSNMNAPGENALVFVRLKHSCDRVVRELKRAGIEARAIHGDKSQGARQEALALFKSGKVNVLIATDIAARGIDIVGLSHVINHDLPNEPEVYIHRIGRTGRAGLEGDAISFCCIDEMKQLAQIEALIGKRIPRRESDWPMQVFEESVPVPRGPRPSKLGMDGNPLRERPSRQSTRAPQGNKPQQPATREPQGRKPQQPVTRAPQARKPETAAPREQAQPTAEAKRPQSGGRTQDARHPQGRAQAQESSRPEGTPLTRATTPTQPRQSAAAKNTTPQRPAKPAPTGPRIQGPWLTNFTDAAPTDGKPEDKP